MMPEREKVMTRWEIINRFIMERNYWSFLEIGTKYGETFRQVAAEVKKSVDPDPGTAATFVMTSDTYFRIYKKDRYDIIFIDGLHESEQAYRDIRNAMKVLNMGGVIVVHDCKPENEEMQQPYHGQFLWTGDVWKAFVKARAELPYECYVIDTDFGCGIIDTTRKKTKNTEGLPTDMAGMSYGDFVKHPEWMDFRKEAEV